MFRKGGRDLLSGIRRRKSWANKPQPPLSAAAPKDHQSDNELDDQRSNSSNSSSSGYVSLVDENKRLKKENGVLNYELSNMKNKCKELLDLVAMYASTSFEKQQEEREDDDEGPKLFGVRLQQEREIRKRKREEINGEIASLFIMPQSCK